MSLVFCENIFTDPQYNTEAATKTISNNIIQIRASKYILYINLVVLIPPQNIFKLFPQIIGLENIVFVKGRYGDLEITIKTVLFNLDR